MSVQLLVPPSAIAATPTVAGSGAAYLLTADPREVWVAPSVATVTVDIDMGAAIAIDSFFLGFTNAAAGATWSIEAGTGLGTGLTTIKALGVMRAADSLGPWHHAFAYLAAPVTSRYFRITANQAGGAALYAGALQLGRAFAKPREYGGGRLPIDTGTRQDLVSGGFGMGGGTVKHGFNWSYIDLSDAELIRLAGIVKDRGLRRPFVLVEDADLAAGQNEAIHYGVFDRLEPYDRQEANATRWGMSMVEWA